MTSRERFAATLAGKKCDRIPFMLEGLRPEVYESWGIQPDRMPHSAQTDQHVMLVPDTEPIPYPENWPVKKSQLPEFLTRLNPRHPERFGSAWQEQTRLCSDPGIIRILRLHNGFFQSMGINDWHRFDETIDLLAESPDFVEEYMYSYTRRTAKILQIALDSQPIDAVYFNEPIGGKNQPLISPADFRRFALDPCAPLFTILKKHGIKNIIFMSYSNVRSLLPMLVENGINCLWSCETDHPDMDYRSIRAEFGEQLRLIGGIDLNLLTLDSDEMKKIFDKKIMPLIIQGGFIPLANGRVRKNILPEKYMEYRKLLFQAISQGGRT